jgi:hypothetical protein
VSILLGDGAGNFSVATNFDVGTVPYSVAVGDFNGDGKQDLAIANHFFDNVSILLGDGAGHFSAATNFATGYPSRSVAVGDFNGDGKQDLAVTNGNSGNVSILLGDGAGHFSPARNFPVGLYPKSVAVGDFNGDGKQDLAFADAILLGDGMGNFSTASNFTYGYWYSVAVGDFNGDGKQDLALTDFSNDHVSILLRICGSVPTPTPTPTPTPSSNATPTATGTPSPPTLGNYADTSILLSSDTAVTPNAAPTNTTSINISISTDFKGTLAGDPSTGLVRITDAHPAGAYAVTITAFNGRGQTATNTFTLTFTTFLTCIPINFAMVTRYKTVNGT